MELRDTKLDWEVGCALDFWIIFHRKWHGFSSLTPCWPEHEVRAVTNLYSSFCFCACSRNKLMCWSTTFTSVLQWLFQTLWLYILITDIPDSSSALLGWAVRSDTDLFLVPRLEEPVSNSGLSACVGEGQVGLVNEADSGDFENFFSWSLMPGSAPRSQSKLPHRDESKGIWTALTGECIVEDSTEQPGAGLWGHLSTHVSPAWQPGHLQPQLKMQPLRSQHLGQGNSITGSSNSFPIRCDVENPLPLLPSPQSPPNCGSATMYPPSVPLSCFQGSILSLREGSSCH